MAEGWKSITAEWKGASVFSAVNERGASVLVGSTPDQPGVGPMEMVLAALAGCTGMDITSILAKQHQSPERFQVFVRGKMADSYPKIYTEIHVTYVLWGDQINPGDVEKAIALSEEKYCSVGIMLGKSVPILSEYRILKPDEEFILETNQEMQK